MRLLGIDQIPTQKVVRTLEVSLSGLKTENLGLEISRKGFNKPQGSDGHSTRARRGEGALQGPERGVAQPRSC